MGLAEGNEEIELLSASGLLSARSSTLAKSIKERKRVWMGKQQQFRIQRANEIRNDLGVSSWNFNSTEDQGAPVAAGDKEQQVVDAAPSSSSSNRPRDGLLELAGSMKRQQKQARQAAMRDDKEWQRARRHDEWDREYDRGRLKKVKAKTDSGHSVGGAGSRGRGGGGGGSSSGHGGVKKQGSNAQRFQRASVLKHGNGQGRTGAVKDHSWVAPVSKTRKKKRKEISKGMKSFRKGGGFKGGNKAKSAPAKFTKKTW